MSYKRISYESKESWLELRSKGIGGSDCAAIVGMNPWMTNVQLFKYKTGLEERPKISNAATEYGHDLEPVIRESLRVDYKGKMQIDYTNELLVDEEYPFLRASLDSEATVLEDFSVVSYFKRTGNNEDKPMIVNLKKGMKGVIEFKTTEFRSANARKAWENQIPDNYYCQELHYQIVKDDCDFGWLRVFIKMEDMNGVITHEIRDYVFLKVDKLEDINFLKNEEIKFWKENVEKKIEPALKINF